MKAEIFHSELSGKITAPPSKSEAERFMITAFLAEYFCKKNKRITVKNVGSSDDVKAMKNVLEALGLKCGFTGSDFYADYYEERSFTGKDGFISADVYSSGATLRFILPVIAALGKSARIYGDKTLLARPNDSLFTALSSAGIKIERKENHIELSGKISKAELTIDRSLSSQYLSGLLFAAPLIAGSVKIKAVGEQSSGGYINMTIAALENIGVTVTENSGIYTVKSDVNDNNIPDELTVKGDYSGAAQFILSGAKTITIENLDKNSLQPDASVLYAVKMFGLKAEWEENEVTVHNLSCDDINDKKGEPLEFFIDCSPDLAEIIAVASVIFNKNAIIYGTKRLRYKESDRIAAIKRLLTAAGIKTEVTDNSIAIYPSKPEPFIFDAGCDHRSVFAATILAAFVEGNYGEKSVIYGADAIKKSYPEFFNDFIKLGGNCRVDL
ncbi:MAG: hypothetical protein HP008_04405 [Clostridia bacterium]|nr:hypothetical protein [Clostridia bacterium]